MKKTFVYISRWNEFRGEPGIALLDYNSESGDIRLIENLEPTLTCNNTAVDKEKNILYITNELKFNPDLHYVKGGGGIVCAYRINPEDGSLTQISRVYACCPCPTYLSIDPTGKYLVCANHSSYNAVTKAVQAEDGSWGYELDFDDATVNLYELNEDGTIGALIDVDKHVSRKEAFMLHSHPHSAVWDPSGSFFACCDKGDDKIYMYRIDYEKGKLVQLCEPYQDRPFSGPRYCVFHPTQPFFYENHESKMFVNAFRYAPDGRLELIQSIDVIPEGHPIPEVKGFLPGMKPNQQAFVMSRDGRFIYDVMNGEGCDAIAVLEVNQETGELHEIQFLEVDGKWARGFGISPDGRFAIGTCLDLDGAVTVYRINPDGTLSETGSRVSIPGASFVTFFEAE